MNKIDVLKKIVDNDSNNPWLLSSDIIDHIHSCFIKDQQNIFALFLKGIDASDLDLSQLDDHFNLSDENYFKFTEAGKITRRILRNLISTNVDEDEFYEKLWNKFNDTDLFPDDDERKAFLLTLWFDVRIPYYQLEESCSMEDDEYEKSLWELSPELKKARFIIYSEFEQKTQRTSLLMALADTIKDYRLRVVFWSRVISLIARFEAAMNDSYEESEDEE
ncbi:MAG: hypothetical protein Q4C20_01090 [Erysipelotrichaceae bacterium]|nr:hypothetical protein [Erysipelotrichaceae bacterium]